MAGSVALITCAVAVYAVVDNTLPRTTARRQQRQHPADHVDEEHVEQGRQGAQATPHLRRGRRHAVGDLDQDRRLDDHRPALNPKIQADTLHAGQRVRLGGDGTRGARAAGRPRHSSSSLTPRHRSRRAAIGPRACCHPGRADHRRRRLPAQAARQPSPTTKLAALVTLGREASCPHGRAYHALPVDRSSAHGGEQMTVADLLRGLLLAG